MRNDRHLRVALISLFVLGVPVAIVSAAIILGGPGLKPATPSQVADIQMVWLLISSMLVFMMQIGFLMFESASVDPRHAQGVATKNFLNVLAAGLGFYLVGFGLMFGASLNGLGLFGSTRFPWMGLTPYEICILLYQAGFAAVTATIVSSALVERSQIIANAIVSAFIAMIVFPVFAHWAWCPWRGASDTPEVFRSDGSALLYSIGWLHRMGFHDFAGSTVVHCVGGIAALAGVQALGPRTESPGAFSSNRPLATVGVLFLWIGWIGFNGGSVHEIADIGRVILNTNFAALAAGISSWAYLRARSNEPNWSRLLVGTMGGLVAITAGSLLFEWWEALALGAISGPFTVEIAVALANGVFPTADSPVPRTVLPPAAVFHIVAAGIGGTALHDLLFQETWFYPCHRFWISGSIWAVSPASLLVILIGATLTFYLSRSIWKRVASTKVDDPVDAIAVHGFAGALGTLMVGVSQHASLLVQTFGVATAIAFSYLIARSLFLLLQKGGLLRVKPEEEREGIALQGVGWEAVPFFTDYLNLAALSKKEAQIRGKLLKHMSNFVHQVSSPLNTALQRLSLALEKVIKQPAPAQAFVEEARVESARTKVREALSRAQGMKLFAMLETSEDSTLQDFIQKQVPFQLNSLIESITNEANSTEGDQRATVKITKDVPLECWVIGNPEFIKQAIANLIENAVIYSHPCGTVKLHYDLSLPTGPRQPPSRFVDLRITNEGLPIGVEDRGSLFEFGKRGPYAATKHPHGTGIGLYFSRKILRIHSGDVIYVPNADNPAETTFTVRLKLHYTKSK